MPNGSLDLNLVKYSSKISENRANHNLTFKMNSNNSNSNIIRTEKIVRSRDLVDSVYHIKSDTRDKLSLSERDQGVKGVSFEDVEGMQSNPSTDTYDDYGEDEENIPGYEDDLYEDINQDELGHDGLEILPEAKSLVQQNDDDEEDMGYDEDDERFGSTIERPKIQISTNLENTGYLNEEGSGSLSRTLNKQFSGETFSGLPKKKQKEVTQLDPRESSGNFANDDEDDEDDNEEEDRFYNSKRPGGNRYFRKNGNDAIKIISTPLGKVGIVYQQSPTQNEEKNHENKDKKATALTDFDALSPDLESSHRLASSHPKITPVLTPDGKVALLYRGDSESSKYEPIRNLTHKFNNKNETLENKVLLPAKKIFDSEESRNESSLSEEKDDTTNDSDYLHNKNDDNKESSKIPLFSDVVPTTGHFIIRPTDSVLPMINRPLSEVLGIKKNQFTQIRIKDVVTSTTTTESGVDHTDTSVRFLTKVNLAEYPSSTRSRNYDFDFSRDNTMLDERSRQRELELRQQMALGSKAMNPSNSNEQKINTIASDEILSKTEVVNLAVIPHFDEELERLQRLRDEEARRHNRKRHKLKQTEEDLSGIHCIMQAMMGIAAISTVFGMLGTFFKQRILDQIRLMHW